MFSGKRSFSGRQGEQSYNEELYKIYEVMKHIIDEPLDYEIGPNSDLQPPGALWIDMQSKPGYAHLTYRDDDKIWKPLFDDWFKIIKDIKYTEGEPQNPIKGQLWINDAGVMMWYNGISFVPIKGLLASEDEYSMNAYENFILINQAKQVGDYIIENLSQYINIAETISKWQANTIYKNNDIVFTTTNNITKFYRYNFTGSYPSNLSFEQQLAQEYLLEIKLKSQYLIPSEKKDKMFLNGLYSKQDSYERISDTCIQISLEESNEKIVAIVHVNPIFLTGITKKLIKVDKNQESSTYGYIEVGPENTEYYGIAGGLGILLTPQAEDFIDNSDNYYVQNSGIKLTTETIAKYDYVYCITYNFTMNVKSNGILTREVVTLNGQATVYIGSILPDEKILVIAHNMLLESQYYQYSLNTGIITIDNQSDGTPLLPDNTEIAVIKFKRKTNDLMFANTSIVNGVYNATITIPGDYIKPILFVGGICLGYINKTSLINNTYELNDIDIDSTYCIVDAYIDSSIDMYYDSGITNAPYITINSSSFGKIFRPLVFVDGFYISTNDLDTSVTNKILINGLTEGQEYVILKDYIAGSPNLLYDNTISFLSIPLELTTNDALVYIDNIMLIDSNAICNSSVSNYIGKQGEIKLNIANGKESWARYDKGTWITITDATEISNLNNIKNGYSIERNSINILQNFGNKQCTYYAYTFANTIQKPLITGYTTTCQEITVNNIKYMFYAINEYHQYTPGVNALSVWINGAKQTIIEYEYNYLQGFMIPILDNIALSPFAYYTIEEPEDGEYKSCIKEILDNYNQVTAGIYDTSSTILRPGMVRIFIDGYRQPQSAYLINDSNTITIIEPPVSIAQNMLVYHNRDGSYQPFAAKSISNIEVEVRQDYTIREQTVVLDEAFININKGRSIMFTSDMIISKQKLSPLLFNSPHSEIQIFINGANYGNNFIVQNSSLILNDSSITTSEIVYYSDTKNISLLRIGDKVTFEWR